MGMYVWNIVIWLWMLLMVIYIMRIMRGRSDRHVANVCLGMIMSFYIAIVTNLYVSTLVSFFIAFLIGVSIILTTTNSLAVNTILNGVTQCIMSSLMGGMVPMMVTYEQWLVMLQLFTILTYFLFLLMILSFHTRTLKWFAFHIITFFMFGVTLCYINL
ncbi:hypothetical protein [Salirhabdus salicampi]|uniref:hypothetical protein n=1 Tax=Salirhabdus salicampi TaxID=476102 RepID=UPI0020C1D946|nr:hypothetical protein [Salirhabdus salicampi]MCP8615976.1 hypothetical protein [Salirhabdus salicampi]